MKAYIVEFCSNASEGTDTVICNNKEEILKCLEERHRGVEIKCSREISLQKVRVKNLTVGDLLNLLK